MAIPSAAYRQAYGLKEAMLMEDLSDRLYCSNSIFRQYLEFTHAYLISRLAAGDAASLVVTIAK
jgi:hypothetical protein